MEATLDLLADLRRGDRAAFVALMRRYNQRLFRAARAVVRDDAEAEDIVQETYLRALANLGQLRGEAMLGAWLTAIAVHEAFARARARRRVTALDEARLDARDPAASPEQRAYEDEVRAAVEAAIDALPPAQRLVFVLRMLEGVSTAETARLLGISTVAVKVRLFRARGAVRRALRRRGELSAGDAFVFLGVRCERTIAAVLRRLSAAP
jgi:RNA polymerase sigma-70 factor (ECF subfamily)